MKDILQELEVVFENAKKHNEFQYLLTIINYKHISSHEESSNLYEWFEAIEFYKELFVKLTGKEKLRVGLLLYSTFFENSDFYNILGSLSKNAMGYGGSSRLFWKTKKQERLLGTGEKIRMISELLSDCKYNQIIDFFAGTHFEQIRNTFFHSAYSIIDNEYVLFDSEPVIMDGKAKYRIQIEEKLLPLIENVILFFDVFKVKYLEGYSTYTSEKHINGYFPDLKDVIVHGTENGLKGITIKKTSNFYGEWHDARIYYDEIYNFWTAKNIVISLPQIEAIEISESLSRYEAKDDIRASDSEFFNLLDKIVERQLKDEMERIIELLVKFGEAKYSKWEIEENQYKKPSLKKHALPFYYKAIQLNRHLDLKYISKKIMELEQ